MCQRRPRNSVRALLSAAGRSCWTRYPQSASITEPRGSGTCPCIHPRGAGDVPSDPSLTRGLPTKSRNPTQPPQRFQEFLSQGVTPRHTSSASPMMRSVRKDTGFIEELRPLPHRESRRWQCLKRRGVMGNWTVGARIANSRAKPASAGPQGRVSSITGAPTADCQEKNVGLRRPLSRTYVEASE